MSTKPPPKLDYSNYAETAFYQRLMSEPEAYLTPKGDHYYANNTLICKNLLLLVLCGLCYLLSLQQVTIKLFALYYFGFVMLTMLANIHSQHDTCHNMHFRKPLANRIFGRLVTLPLGVDPHYWRVRHVDYPHIRYQTHYWPFIAGLPLPYIAWVFDWSDQLRKTSLAADNKTLTDIKGWGLFLASKILHFTIALIVPMHILVSMGISWYLVLLVYLITPMLSSLFIVCLLLGTHWVDPVFYTAPKNNQIKHGGYHQQFTPCCDWYSSPKIFNELLSGLNLHLTHHLFLGWNHRHYSALMLTVERFAKEYQLSYRRLSYPELLTSQLKFISKMAQKPEL